MNIGDTKQINHKRLVIEKRMAERDKNWKVALVKGIDAAAKQCEARLGEGFRNQAIVFTVPNVVVKSERSPRVHPGLNYGEIVELSA